MSLEAQLETAGSQRGAAPVLASPRREIEPARRDLKPRSRLLGVVLWLALLSPTVRAEGWWPNLRAGGQSPLLAYVAWSPSSSTAASHSWFSPAASASSLWASFELSEYKPTHPLLLELNRPSGRLLGKSVVLWRKRLHSRYAGESWAKLNAGYGQFFAGDTVGRSLTSGAGLQDRDWIFLRVSFALW